jgi:hypothetical protein
MLCTNKLIAVLLAGIFIMVAIGCNTEINKKTDPTQKDSSNSQTDSATKSKQPTLQLASYRVKYIKINIARLREIQHTIRDSFKLVHTKLLTVYSLSAIINDEEVGEGDGLLSPQTKVESISLLQTPRGSGFIIRRDRINALINTTALKEILLKPVLFNDGTAEHQNKYIRYEIVKALDEQGRAVNLPPMIFNPSPPAQSFLSSNPCE